MKRLSAYTVTFILLWAMWRFMCPDYLRILEGFDFFTDLPDFTRLNMEIPQPVFNYISAFLLQLYSSPALGAAVNSIITMTGVLCVNAIVQRLFKESGNLWWVALTATPAFTGALTQDLNIVKALIWLTASASAAAVVCAVMWKRKPFISLPKIFGNVYAGAVIAIVSVGASAHMTNDRIVKSGVQDMAEMDYLIENGEWDRILQKVTPEDAGHNEYMRKCALLALTHTGRLAENAFTYGLSGPDDFSFKKPQTAFFQNFNLKFYNSLGMHNPTVYYAYQLSNQFLLGMCFKSARTLAETYIDSKDYPLARKYVEVLKHSTFHGEWVEEHMSSLEDIKNSVPEHVTDPEQSLWGNMLYDMPLMIERNPDDSRYRDLFLCSILADKNGKLFLKMFTELAASVYTDGQRIPKAYQEALLICLGPDKAEAMKYGINGKTFEDFIDFTRLIGSGKEKVARQKYTDTYWAYLYFSR